MADTLINFNKGITHSPSDFLSVDGELEECVNLELTDGELRPTEMPVPIKLELAVNERLECVHTTESGVYSYITLTTDKPSQATTIYTLKGYRKVNEEFIAYTFSKTFTTKPLSVLSIGNILIVYFEDSVAYFLFKNSDYTYLGDKFPELDIAFSLTGSIRSNTYDISDAEWDDSNDSRIGLPAMTTGNDSIILGHINEFISEEITNEGYFIYPFFVRWAYRLFDGTHTMQSAPILLIPSTYLSPLAGLKSSTGDDKDMFVAAYAAEIVMNIASDQLDELKKWSDIITGIDIYVSKQIYSYDSSQSHGEMVTTANMSRSKFDTEDEKRSYFLGYTDTAYHQYNGKHNLFECVHTASGSFSYYTFTLPNYSEDEMRKEICETSLFYRYAALDIDDVEAGDTSLKEKGLEVTSNDVITQQETLDDDYQSHDVLVPKTALVYNKRVNMSYIRRRLFYGFTARAMLQDLDYTTGMGVTNKAQWEAIVKVSGEWITAGASTACPYCLYLYYPSVDATMMSLSTDSQYFTVNLKEHTGLNGAYFFGGFGEPTFYNGKNTGSINNIWETQANALWLSEVSNPFQFDLNGMYTVGNGSLIGLSALVRPVSQGQFGEYPLIAFCTDGNYGLRVSDEGYYTNISPMQEDIVLSQEQITNMESSILIITKKGLMETTGSEITTLIPNMDGRIIARQGGLTQDGYDTLLSKTEDSEGFLAYLFGARIAYDYARNRALIYRSDKTYCYLLAMDSKTVSKMVIGEGETILTHVIDYPDVILQTDKQLYSLYTKEDINTLSDHRKGFLLTRPLKLDAPMFLKVVERVKSLWTKVDGDSSVKYALFGSCDGIHFYPCFSRWGKAWKMYKLAIYTDLLPGEGLAGTEVSSSLRRNHKLR